MKRANRSWIFGIGLIGLLSIAGLEWGAVSHLDLDSVIQLRLSRVLLAMAVGISLAVAGSILQALFSNPLCEPYTLGMSSGAAVGAVILATLGVSLDWSGLGGGALLGALVFGGVLWGVAGRARVSPATLLLVGVLLGFLGSSIVALWMAMADPNGVQSAVFWLLGDLSRARVQGAVFVLCVAIGGAVWTWLHSEALDTLLLGEEDARSLGVATRRVRRRLLWVSCTLVAFSVSAAGMVGFVGLVVPHFVRRTSGALHRRLVPLVSIWGAVSLLFSDLVGRVAARPFEVPVGVVTALWGAPVFLWILLKRDRVRGVSR